MTKTKRTGALAAAACAALLCAPGAASAADAIFALTDDNRLLRFNSDTPNKIQQTIPVQGLQAGETLVGIDYRPANDHLYAVGSANRLYQVNPVTGASRRVFDVFGTPLQGGSFGVDFNPVADALRIVSDADQNLRIPFGGNNAGNVNNDAPLQYAAGDPNAGQNPSVAGAAYTNSFPGAENTTLYDIDTARDTLVRQDPPNQGTLNTIGPLGVDVDALGGFDISPQGNVAYAAMRVVGTGATRHQLYRIDLGTGRATEVQQLSAIYSEQQLRGIAVATGGVDDDRTPPQVSVAFSSTILEQNATRPKPTVSCNEQCNITATISVEGREAGSTSVNLDGPGRASLPIELDATARRRIARPGTERLALSVSVSDAAGLVTTPPTRLSRTQTLRARLGG